MKVIFLDIDGVLNTHYLPEVIHEFNGIKIGFNQLNKETIKNLNTITDFTDAKIVISSSWRMGCKTPERFDVLKNFLKTQGVTGEILGRTPIGEEYGATIGNLVIAFPRGREIQLWLKQYPGVITNFVIIDDGSDMEHLTPHLIQTDFEVGLVDGVAVRVIEKLMSVSYNG